MSRFIHLLGIVGVLLFVGCTEEGTDEYLGNWQTRSEFLGSGRGYAASFVIGDEGYVCGGWNGTNARRVDSYRFKHTAAQGRGAWEKIADFTGEARQQAVGFAVDGKGYVGLGWDGGDNVYKDFYCYDKATDEWTKVTDEFPGVARHSAVAFSLKKGGKEVAFVGLGHTAGNDREVLKDFYMFDPSQPEGSRWKEIDPFAGTKRYGAVVFVIDNEAYICTGTSANGTVIDFWKFNVDGIGTADGPWKSLRHISNSNPDEDFDDDYGDLARSYAVAFVASVNGVKRGHIALGSTSKSSVWEYEHEQDQWVRRTSFYNNAVGQARFGATAFSFDDGKAFVGLGASGTSTCYDSFFEFLPMETDNSYDDY